MSALATTSGPTLLWYLARGSGLAALVLLTVTMVLGIVTSVRWTNPRWPRFVIELLHRNASLIAFVLIVVHVATVILDGFAPIGWKDAVIPFVSPYRTVWLGLGSIAFDLLVAVLVTSLLRHRLGHRTWRFVHWFAYLCWPLVVVHGLATGTDTHVSLVLMLTMACVAAVILAAWWRLAVGWPDHIEVRASGILASLVAPIVLLIWLASGPLAPGWTRRSGTPASVLARLSSTSAAGSSASPPTTAAPAAGAGALPAAPFSVQVAGAVDQSTTSGGGQVTVTLTMTMAGAATGSLEVDLTGQPVEGGGVLLNTSRVQLGPVSQPALYTGHVVALVGQRIDATVTSSGHPALELLLDAQIAGSRVAGTLQVQAGNSSGEGGGQ